MNTKITFQHILLIKNLYYNVMIRMFSTFLFCMALLISHLFGQESLTQFAYDKHKIDREEIKDYRTALKEELY
ncbi:hypothetical protein CW751_02650 [Brumimicrobium salinarum]|uniref:Uncharacterized protein n=1 Tax=Brumimicrobium salinarum TaxID=2058658 RepID=A0A2I0R768_9FLAO|nr:hypothetical protein CW751_02650 [Brumimicrobium salinarum]